MQHQGNPDTFMQTTLRQLAAKAPAPTHSLYRETPGSSGVDIGIVMFGGIGYLVGNRLTAQCQDRVLCDRHEKNDAIVLIVLADLDFTDSLQELLRNDDSLLSDLGFHVHYFLHTSLYGRVGSS